MKLNNLNKTLFALSFMCLASSVSAAKITYEVADLSDTTAGEDLWKYTYTVSDHIFNADDSFSIFFDPQKYSNLESFAPAVNIDWDILVLQPDNLLPHEGIYDAFSLSNGASLADPFTLNFVWTGNGLPGAQAYNIYDDAFNVVASGMTTPVPEPSSLFLMLSGLMGLLAFKKSRLFKITGEKS